MIVAALCLLGSVFQSAPRSPDQKAAELGLELDRVFESPFSHTLPSEGLIDSLNNSTLSSQVVGRTTVLDLIPAGTEVQAPVKARSAGTVITVSQPTTGEVVVVVQDADGQTHNHHCRDMGEYTEVFVEAGDVVRRSEPLIGDVVARLDPSQLLDQEKKFEIAYTRAKTNYELAVNNYIVRKINNESKNAAARLAADLADLDLQKYLNGLYPQQKEKLEGSIQQLKEDLTRAGDTLTYSERMVSKGYQSAIDVENAKLKLLAAQVKLKDAQKQYEVLEDFTFDRTRIDLKRKAENAAHNLRRIRLAGEAALAQDRSNRASRERVYEIYRSRLQHVRDQIKTCTLVAPRAGKVVHANLSYRRSGNTYVEVGSQVYERQPIVHIPDMSHMRVDARIHESLISKVGIGLPVEIRVDAIPDIVLHGELTDLSSVPMPGQYPNYHRKEYRAEIAIDDDECSEFALRPGMSAKLDLIVHRASESFVQIPIQSVLKLRDKRFAWVFGEAGPELRLLELGRDNDETYVVHEGVRPGEQVVLHPWKHFTDQIAQLETRYGVEETVPVPYIEEPQYFDEPDLPGELAIDLDQTETAPSQSTRTARVDAVGEE